MKTNLLLLFIFLNALPVCLAQKPDIPAAAAEPRDDGSRANPPRITFMLKNTLGYHRMFRVEGPGIAYGFTMNKRETVPCHWPVGAKLYFSRDGETTTGLILTVTATDEGKTLGTDTGTTEIAETKLIRQTSPDKKLITIWLRNPGLRPRKVALISYEPGETGNSTRIFTLAPLVGLSSVRFPVGTRLYLANNEQVGVVMSGKSINNGQPFLTVQASDAGKVFNLP